MAEVPIAALKAVARELDKTGLKYVFTGGSIIGLLLDYPEVVPIRPTDDVDIILEILTHGEYSAFEASLRDLGFSHDTRKRAPRCRWTFRNLVVDTMPVKGTFLGLNTAWFDYALTDAMEIELDGVNISVISPPTFIATKLAAFTDRGDGDFFASHDLEDIITVIDGREKIVKDLENAPIDLRRYVSKILSEYLVDYLFMESLSGHLPPDQASQARLPMLEKKLKFIAEFE